MTNLVPLHIDKDTGDFVAKNLTGTSVPGGATGFVHEETTPITTWTVVHNMNSTQLICQIFDTSGELLLPDSLIINDVNMVTVNFAAPQDGKAHLMFFSV